MTEKESKPEDKKEPNVILFPKKFSTNDAIQTQININYLKTDTLVQMTELMVGGLLDNLTLLGVDIDKHKTRVMFAITVIKSLNAEHLGLPHVLDDFYEDNIDYIEDAIDEDGVSISLSSEYDD